MQILASQTKEYFKVLAMLTNHFKDGNFKKSLNLRNDSQLWQGTVLGRYYVMFWVDFRAILCHTS